MRIDWDDWNTDKWGPSPGGKVIDLKTGEELGEVLWACEATEECRLLLRDDSGKMYLFDGEVATRLHEGPIRIVLSDEDIEKVCRRDRCIMEEKAVCRPPASA